MPTNEILRRIFLQTFHEFKLNDGGILVAFERKQNTTTTTTKNTALRRRLLKNLCDENKRRQLHFVMTTSVKYKR